ncbi:MAG TPA: zinc ribbon domain-containing protein [Thermoanaerobaculia bacterium]|nr:zinc ribbon domain-containing protein [Thermoanaerobaculia bacterium]
MPRYRCENCNEPRDAAVCPKCGADTRLLDDAALDDLVSRVSRQAAAAEAPRPKPAAPAVETPRADAPPPPAPHSPSVASANAIIGLDEFHALLGRGTEAVIICGAARTGKSEIAAGYIRANTIYLGKAQNVTLRAVLRTEYALGATNPDEVWYQVIDDQRAFLDPSGEFFRRLSPDERQRHGLPDVTDEDFAFIQRAVRQLAGIVLVVDLTSAVDPRAAAPWRRQEDDLKFVLSALRWLRFDRLARPETIGISTNIASRVSTLSRIDKRVLVLFSKADQLGGKFTNQSPLDFARKRLPVLHAALMTHARRFRYDFCNTMIKTESGDQAVDPCGVLLPMTWLLDRSFSWLPQLPTSMIGGGK